MNRPMLARDAYWRHVVNMIDRSVLGGDADFCFGHLFMKLTEIVHYIRQLLVAHEVASPSLSAAQDEQRSSRPVDRSVGAVSPGCGDT